MKIPNKLLALLDLVDYLNLTQSEKDCLKTLQDHLEKKGGLSIKQYHLLWTLAYMPFEKCKEIVRELKDDDRLTEREAKFLKQVTKFRTYGQAYFLYKLHKEIPTRDHPLPQLTLWQQNKQTIMWILEDMCRTFFSQYNRDEQEFIRGIVKGIKEGYDLTDDAVKKINRIFKPRWGVPKSVLEHAQNNR